MKIIELREDPYETATLVTGSPGVPMQRRVLLLSILLVVAACSGSHPEQLARRRQRPPPSTRIELRAGASGGGRHLARRVSAASCFSSGLIRDRIRI